MMMWLQWWMVSCGHSRFVKLSERSWMGRLCLTNECSIAFSMISLLSECSWHSMRMCAAVCTSPHSQKRVSARPILNMWFFSLLFSVITLIHMLSWALVLPPALSLLVGTDGNMVWRFLLLSGKCQAHCHFLMVDFFILCLIMEMDVGLLETKLGKIYDIYWFSTSL